MLSCGPPKHLYSDIVDTDDLDKGKAKEKIKLFHTYSFE